MLEFKFILIMLLTTTDGYVKNELFPRDRYETIEHCKSERDKINTVMENGGVYPTIKMECVKL